MSSTAYSWQTVELTTQNGSFKFNGTNQTLNLGNSPVLQVSAHDFTVQAWVKFKSTTQGGPPCFGPGCDMYSGPQNPDSSLRWCLL